MSETIITVENGKARKLSSTQLEVATHLEESNHIPRSILDKLKTEGHDSITVPITFIEQFYTVSGDELGIAAEMDTVDTEYISFPVRMLEEKMDGVTMGDVCELCWQALATVEVAVVPRFLRSSRPICLMYDVCETCRLSRENQHLLMRLNITSARERGGETINPVTKYVLENWDEETLAAIQPITHVFGEKPHVTTA